MSESMTFERMLLTKWEQDGFFGRTRVRVPREEGSWRELDALATSYKQGVELRVGEVKVRGGATTIFPVDNHVDEMMRKSDGTADSWLEGWKTFLDTCSYLYQDDISPVFGLPKWEELTSFEVWFVFNGWVIDPAHRSALEKGIRTSVLKRWGYKQQKPHDAKKFSVKVVTTIELIRDVTASVFKEIEAGRGVRYGEEFLDVVREVHRYLYPKMASLPNEEENQRSKRCAPYEKECRESFISIILQAMGFDSSPV